MCDHYGSILLAEIARRERSHSRKNPYIQDNHTKIVAIGSGDAFAAFKKMDQNNYTH